MLAALDLTVLIGPVIGVVGIAVSIYLWRRGRARPAVSYRLTSPPVVNVHREVEDRISVFYDNERVTDVRLLDLRVENTGNVDISAGAFEEPLSVPLGVAARVLNRPNVGKTVPPELRPQVSVDGRDLVIAPLLLNAGDSFEVTVLVSQLSDSNRLRARIAGVPKSSTQGQSPASAGGWAGQRCLRRALLQPSSRLSSESSPASWSTHSRFGKSPTIIRVLF